MAEKPSVLFVCVHNAGRSQMAAALLSHLTGDRIEVRSAGTVPADAINPVVVAAMDELGIDISAATPQAPHRRNGADQRHCDHHGLWRQLPVLSGRVLPRLETARSGRAGAEHRADHPR